MKGEGNAACPVASRPPDAVILLWKVNDSKEPEQLAFPDEDEAELNKEHWTVVKTLRWGRGASSPGDLVQLIPRLDFCISLETVSFCETETRTVLKEKSVIKMGFLSFC